MKAPGRQLSVVFAAGALGGFANAVTLWAAGRYGVTAALGVAVNPGWSPPFIYRQVVWGGLWGALFLLPLLRRSVLLRGVLFSLAPTLVALLVVLPAKGHGAGGLGLGALMPLVVLVANAVWGVVAAAWVRTAG